MRFYSSIRLFFFLLIVAVSPVSAQPSFDFEALFDNRYRQESVEAPNWMKNGTYYTALIYNDSTESVELRKYHILQDGYEVLVTEKQLLELNNDVPISIEEYQFSADETKLLIQTEVEALWRRSRIAKHYIYDLSQKTLKKLSQYDEKQGNAAFSPAGNKVAFTRDNNLFVVDIETGKETAITTDGMQNSIINGSTDWVYEEEFSFAKAWFWAPDGSSIAYYRFDETAVREFFYTLWGSFNYPDQMKYKYPKAGEKNADVSLHVYSLASNRSKKLDFSDKSDFYIVRVNWTANPKRLAVRTLNRLQNNQELWVFDVEKDTKELLKKETSATWIEENDDLTFLSDGKSFVYVSEEDGFNHIYLYTDNGKKSKQLTKGKFDTHGIVGINEKKKLIYYISSEESPMERHLYQIDFNGKKKKKLTQGEGVHDIEMSRDQSYYLDYYTADNKPLLVTLHSSDGKQQKVLEDNRIFNEYLSENPLLRKTYIKIPVSDSLSLNAWMVFPPNFDSTKSYPVLLYVYGGPGSQTVLNEFDSSQRALWHMYLAHNGYIVVSADNRGTGARGAAFKKQIYKQLGVIEIQDQIAIASYLAKKTYVDSTRIGIWGWSYGGFMSTLGLVRGSDVFKAAIAVAPVTDWRFYDTIYTERYMQTPQENPDGYRISSPVYEASSLKGHYLLIHGTGDDNVHFQHAVVMADALQHYAVPFETMFYPNRNHGIYGGQTRRHLYSLMTRFILEKL